MEVNLDSNLTVAAGTGNLELLGQVIDDEYDISAQDAIDGITALHVACCALSLHLPALSTPRNTSKRDSVAFLKRLADQVAARIDSPDGHGQTALHYAVQAGHPEYVKVLINHGANLDVKDKSCMTPLLLAIRLRMHSCVKILIDEHANVNLADSRGLTPLMWAAHLKDVTSVGYLLCHPSISLTEQNHNGLTALHIAMTQGEREIIRSLVLAGAPTDVTDKAERRPVDMIKDSRLLSFYHAVLKEPRKVLSAATVANTKLNKLVNIDDIADIVPTSRQMMRRETVLMLYEKYYKPKPAGRKQKAGKLYDSNVDMNLTYKQLRALCLKSNVPIAKKLGDLSNTLAEKQYAPAVGQIDARLCIKEILDPNNSALAFRRDGRPVYGLFASQPILRGDILGEYAGEVKEYEYMMSLGRSSRIETRLSMDYHHELHHSIGWISGGLVVDGQEFRNALAFANDYRSFNEQPHRKQNVMFREVVIDGWPHIFATAVEDIEAGEELLADYGEHFWESQEDMRSLSREVEQESTRKVQDERMRCRNLAS